MKTYARSVMLGSVLLYFVLFCSVLFGSVWFNSAERVGERECVCVFVVYYYIRFQSICSKGYEHGFAKMPSIFIGMVAFPLNTPPNPRNMRDTEPGFLHSQEYDSSEDSVRLWAWNIICSCKMIGVPLLPSLIGALQKWILCVGRHSLFTGVSRHCLVLCFDWWWFANIEHIPFGCAGVLHGCWRLNQRTTI